MFIGRKWIGRSEFYFIYLFNSNAYFLLLQHRFCIHNGKRKLKLATVSANHVLSYFFTSDRQLFLCEYILENVEKDYRRGIVERVGRVTVNTRLYFRRIFKVPYQCITIPVRTIIPKDRFWDKVEFLELFSRKHLWIDDKVTM